MYKKIMKKIVSIIAPCYNEEGNINDFYDELNKQLTPLAYDFEFVFVNDGSKDQTLNILKTLARSDNRIKVVDFSKNFGKEAAILAGLDYASGEAAIIIDADLQMPVTKIKDLIELWQEGNKLVLTYKNERKKGLKSFLATKYYDVYNYLSDDKIIKNALDFQIMDREVIDVICSMRERSRFFKGITGFIGYNYKMIPIEINDRTSGESKFGGFKTLFNYAFRSFAIHSDIPLKIALKIGTVISMVGFIYMLYIFFKTLIKGVDVSGYASLIIVMLFMFGIVLLILGIMGYYIALIYNEVKQRPNYIVNEVIVKDEKGE
ncbi:glycosyltransferase involved in cell wall biosynthesis [Bacilli bacterium PM5-3]|nr:glycosyltransferase involved in cell wall biosynthesis [Bacilli bacterium PM5-3]MDH6603943.1 glycosyltransferase involved in cell wall biosynthesis [Bacilli bacterium PM5-9]